MSTTTDEYNALNFIGGNACIGQLLIDVSDDFACAGTDVVSRLASIHALNDYIVGIDGVKRVVDIFLDILGNVLDCLGANHHIAGEVTSTHGQRVEIDQRLVLVNGHGCCLGAHVNKHAAQLTFTFIQNLVGYCQRCNDIILGRNAKCHQTVEVQLERRLCHNQVDLNFYGRAKLAYGVRGLYLVYIIGTGHDIDRVIIAYRGTGGILDNAINEFSGDGLGRADATIYFTDNAVQ